MVSNIFTNFAGEMETPAYLRSYELAEILCVSQRTAERRLHDLKQSLGLPRWSPITTDQVAAWFHIGREKIDRYFQTQQQYSKHVRRDVCV